MTDAAIEGYLPMCHRVVRRGCRRYPWLDQDDLTSAVQMALVGAVRRFRAGQAQSIRNFVYRRLVGAVQDEVRRSARRQRLAACQSWDDLPVWEQERAWWTVQCQSRAAVRALVAPLVARERYILTARAYGWEQREIAQRLRVSQSLVCQLEARAVRRLRQVYGVGER